MDSVLLRYELNSRKNFQCCAEFLRLLGIFLCEDIDYGDENVYSKENENIFPKYNAYDFSAICKIPSESMPSDQLLGELKILLGIENDENESELEAAYDILKDVFLDYQLLFAATKLQYYVNNKQRLEEARESFVNAADYLWEKYIRNERKRNANRYLFYGCIYCMQRANAAQYLIDQNVVIYYLSKLEELADELYENHDGFVNAKVMGGLVYENRWMFQKEMIEHYNDSISHIKKQPYVASVYYRLGKCLEGERAIISDQALQAYASGYKANLRFRSVYKVGAYFMRTGMFRDAEYFFDIGRRILERKNYYLDPVEMEYLFKFNIHICYCLIRQQNYLGAMRVLDRADEFHNKLLRDMSENYLKNDSWRYIKELYEDDRNFQFEDYANATMARIRDRQIENYRYTINMAMSKNRDSHYKEKSIMNSYFRPESIMESEQNFLVSDNWMKQFS